jgi:hypothetical protein
MLQGQDIKMGRRILRVWRRGGMEESRCERGKRGEIRVRKNI